MTNTIPELIAKWRAEADAAERRGRDKDSDPRDVEANVRRWCASDLEAFCRQQGEGIEAAAREIAERGLSETATEEENATFIESIILRHFAPSQQPAGDIEYHDLTYYVMRDGQQVGQGYQTWSEADKARSMFAQQPSEPQQL